MLHVKHFKVKMKIQRKHLIQLMKPFIDDFEYYKNSILENNAKYNLTSIKSEDFYEKHFLDSLAIYPLLIRELYNSVDNQNQSFLTEYSEDEFYYEAHSMSDLTKESSKLKIADVGSGAGFPSIPLLIVNKNLNITMIESNHKKSDFLKSIIDHYAFANARVICSNVKEVKEKFDIIVFRAFASIDNFLKNSRSIFSSNAKIFAMKGKKSEIENEILVVKNIKLCDKLRGVKYHEVIGFDFERNIVELIWGK